MLLVTSLVIVGHSAPETDRRETGTLLIPTIPGLILVLLLFSTAVRALIGLTVAFAATASLTWVMGMALAAALGKAAGGVIADRFGWGRVAVGAMFSTPGVM